MIGKNGFGVLFVGIVKDLQFNFGWWKWTNRDVLHAYTMKKKRLERR